MQGERIFYRDLQGIKREFISCSEENIKARRKIRLSLSEDERYALDRQLVKAVECGNNINLHDCLVDGANPNTRHLGSGDQVLSLAREPVCFVKLLNASLARLGEGR